MKVILKPFLWLLFFLALGAGVIWYSQNQQSGGYSPPDPSPTQSAPPINFK